MTDDASHIAFKVLLVDDDMATVTSLATLLQHAILGITIDTAETVEEAHALIDAAQRSGEQYELGLLDFYLPRRRGSNPEVDTTICRALKRGKVPIIHFSGWPDDPQIKQHMAEIHPEDELAGAAVCLIPKTASGEWAQHILEIVERYGTVCIGSAVRERISRVFGDYTRHGEGESGPQRHAFADADDAKCGTHALIQLHKDIVQYWSILTPEIKAEIRQLFPVVALDDSTQHLSMLPPETR